MNPHIPWNERPWAHLIPEDQLGGPHTVDFVDEVTSGDDRGFTIKFDGMWNLSVENPEHKPLPEKGETVYVFGVANYGTTVAIGDVLYRVQSSADARAEVLRSIEERTAAMEAATPALEEKAARYRNMITLKNEADYQIGREKNRDPYGSAIYRFAETWMALLEDEVLKETKAGATVAEAIAKHGKETSSAADTEGITGFMYGAAGHIIARAWVHGEAFRRWYNIENQIRDEGEKANEKEGATLNPAVMTIG